jgi:hypothetical protein
VVSFMGVLLVGGVVVVQGATTRGTPLPARPGPDRTAKRENSCPLGAPAPRGRSLLPTCTDPGLTGSVEPPLGAH